MNLQNFWNNILAAYGSTAKVSNVNQFRSEFVAAVDGATFLDTTDVEAAIADKTEIAALVALGGTITGATANDTMTAVADIALSTGDSYTDAAVNSAVNAAIASIENNFADLQTKVNAIIAALKA